MTPKAMKKLLNQNSYAAGIALCMALEAATALLLWVGLTLFHTAAADHVAWFACILIGPLFVMRWLVYKQQTPKTVKGMIIALFITTLAYIWLYLKTNPLT